MLRPADFFIRTSQWRNCSCRLLASKKLADMEYPPASSSMPTNMAIAEIFSALQVIVANAELVPIIKFSYTLVYLNLVVPAKGMEL